MKKILIVLLLLIMPFIGCQRKTSPNVTINEIVESDDFIKTKIIKDPFLLFYLRNYPTLIVDNSENVMIQRISYDNFDNKEISYGDIGNWTSEYSIYLFENCVFSGIDEARVLYTELIMRSPSVQFERSLEGYISNLNYFYYDNNCNIIEESTSQHKYNKDGNAIIQLHNSNIPVAVAAVIIEKNNKYLYYNNYQNYNNDPNKPDIIIEINGIDAIITTYTTLFQREISSRNYYTNGILMKVENHPMSDDGYIETYTVDSGIGEIIETSINDDTVLSRKFLERRINTDGFLEYEAVKYPSGEGYEIFITKDIFY